MFTCVSNVFGYLRGQNKSLKLIDLVKNELGTICYRRALLTKRLRRGNKFRVVTRIPLLEEERDSFRREVRMWTNVIKDLEEMRDFDEIRILHAYDHLKAPII